MFLPERRTSLKKKNAESGKLDSPAEYSQLRPLRTSAEGLPMLRFPAALALTLTLTPFAAGAAPGEPARPAAPAGGGDWSQWLGPKRDGSSSESVEPWKDAPKVLWKAKVGVGFSTPVIVDGKVFVHARINGKDREEL